MFFQTMPVLLVVWQWRVKSAMHLHWGHTLSLCLHMFATHIHMMLVPHENQCYAWEGFFICWVLHERTHRTHRPQCLLISTLLSSQAFAWGHFHHPAPIQDGPPPAILCPDPHLLFLHRLLDRLLHHHSIHHVHHRLDLPFPLPISIGRGRRCNNYHFDKNIIVILMK